MRRQSDRTRLALALGASVLLHLPLLWEGNTPAPEGEIVVAGSPEASLTAVLPGDVASRPARPSPSATNAAPVSEPRPAPTPDDRGHYASAQLSRAPRPLTAIDLDLPEAQLLTTPGRIVLSLWIDAEGVVLAFQVDAPDIPEEYATAVAEAFSAARFAPGELLGRKVPSVLKLEIFHEAGGRHTR